MSEFSLGNSVNARDIRITATEGDIRAKQTDFTSRDSEGKRQADSRIQLNAYKDLILESGQSAEKFKGKQQSAGFESGVGFAVGAQTGLYIYAQAGFTQGKQEERHVTQHNSHLDTAHLSLTSGGDTTLSGAVAKANRIDTDIKGNLRIESRQDEHLSKSSSSGGGLRVQGGIGTAWGASGYANASSGKAQGKQVIEQSGLFAEEGGYHINADNVHLKGAAIASTNATNSELKTNKLTFEDIQNESQSRAISGGISGSANLTKAMGNTPITGAQAKQQSEFAKLTGTSQSNHLSPTVPMYDSEQDRSITKATLTEGRIILNKDSAPRETTAAEQGINTDITDANRQVSAPKDIQKVLKEQQIISQNVGHMMAAATAFSDNRAKVAKEAEDKAAEELETAIKRNDTASLEAKIAAYDEAKAENQRWQDGGSSRRKVDAAVAVVGAILSGKTAAQTAVAGLSPELNAKIHDLTQDNKAANLFSHAVLSATEFYAAGLDPAAGALAGVAGEGVAMVLSEKVFNKPAEQLTTSERNLLKTASQLAGAVVGGISGNSTTATLEGVATAKRAVENNYLYNGEVDSLVKELAKAEKEGKDTKPIFEKYAKLSERNRREMLEECGNNPVCYLPHIQMMNKGDEAAYENFSGLRLTSYFNGLSDELKAKMSDFVEQENAKTRAELPQSLHYGTLALGAAEAVGLGGLALKDKLPKLSFSGKDKNYPKTGMDNHQRAKVGDSDYPSGAENIALYPKLKEQLHRENILNIGKLDPKLQELTDKLGKELNYGISGISSVHEANRLGRLWVGNDASEIVEKDKVIGWKSQDNTRVYRLPSAKPNARESKTKTQANFETYKIDPISKERIKIGNGHLDIKD